MRCLPKNYKEITFSSQKFHILWNAKQNPEEYVLMDVDYFDYLWLLKHELIKNMVTDDIDGITKYAKCELTINGLWTIFVLMRE